MRVMTIGMTRHHFLDATRFRLVAYVTSRINPPITFLASIRLLTPELFAKILANQRDA
jgi:hypothetical protein